MFRNSRGTVTALEDRCPHRFAPLSRGRREGDAIVCGYHGLTFDGSGACDHWLDMRWSAPASMVLAIGLGPADAPKGPSRMQAHILTPATQSTTHYCPSTPAQ